MMFNYPFFGFRNPYRYYNPTLYKNRYNTNYTPYTLTPKQETHKQEANNIEISKAENEKGTTTEEQFFSILGIKLYYDDLIILALLYFLYSEGIKDQGLFISLILLLLS